jgi:hypothetical protein
MIEVASRLTPHRNRAGAQYLVTALLLLQQLQRLPHLLLLYLLLQLLLERRRLLLKLLLQLLLQLLLLHLLPLLEQLRLLRCHADRRGEHEQDCKSDIPDHANVLHH